MHPLPLEMELPSSLKMELLPSLEIDGPPDARALLPADERPLLARDGVALQDGVALFAADVPPAAQIELHPSMLMHPPRSSSPRC